MRRLLMAVAVAVALAGVGYVLMVVGEMAADFGARCRDAGGDVVIVGKSPMCLKDGGFIRP